MIKKEEFTRELVQLIHKLDEVKDWKQLMEFLNNDISTMSEKYHKRNFAAKDNLEDVFKLIYRLTNNLD